ncbi:Calcineurin-like phosphoesterase [Thermincola ferriacetica]|uniref:Calcineurin-like phosphoesterase n=1 Tax=Thermincola ferriacetica TaxID=281456 RepID=A0A0L6W2S0_9FIRM|nr:metallophosphoesterase family protein [Thermincola ferriacetica]KNZ69673.1 Calcineurin-like phosphoesterase [Thermincola ferriacetica]
MGKAFFSNFIRLCILVPFLVFTACSSLSAANKPVNQATSSFVPDHIALTWILDPGKTQTISWKTGASVKKGVLQYAKLSDGAAFLYKARTINATVYQLLSDSGRINIDYATVNGLEPGNTYLYRVGDGKNWSSFHSFKTEPLVTKSFKFLIFGDSQSDGNYTSWKNTVRSAYKFNPDAKFFVVVGDLVDRGTSSAHWNAWFEGAKGVIDSIPAMVVRGNHETNRAFWSAQFKLPQNGPDGAKGLTYSFDYGDAHFVMLDNIEEKEIKALNAQKAWLANDLKNTKKTWKLVFFHKPPFYSKGKRANNYLKAAYGPIFDRYHVDVVFNGHDHVVARTYPMYGGQPAKSPSKGTIYYITGRSGSKYYKDSSRKSWDTFFYNPTDEPNYIIAEVSKNKLTLKSVKQDETCIDTYTINK